MESSTRSPFDQQELQDLESHSRSQAVITGMTEFRPHLPENARIFVFFLDGCHVPLSNSLTVRALARFEGRKFNYEPRQAVEAQYATILPNQSSVSDAKSR